MNIGLIGLGKMGEAIGYRASRFGHTVYGFDINQSVELAQSMHNIGIKCVDKISDFSQYPIDFFWLMVPQGLIVDKVVGEILSFAQPGTIIVDGGNSKFTDSMRRAKELLTRDMFFIDCGTSGGVHGRENGFCLMVGGDKKAYDKIEDALKSVATNGGCAYVGPSGAGHYVKMVHNGIEYGILQAYAEGFHLLKDGEFKDAHLDLEQIAHLWNDGSVIRSWILDLVENVMKVDQNLNDIAGNVAATGMGLWTVESAEKSNIPVPVIKESVSVRDWSEQTGGNYATKLVAMLRNQFGGHVVTKIKREINEECD